jgi:hypothetical protein
MSVSGSASEKPMEDGQAARLNFEDVLADRSEDRDWHTSKKELWSFYIYYIVSNRHHFERGFGAINSSIGE